jgi:type I restriction enzyme M protein
VLKKSKADNATLFIDASKEFIHIGNKNKLSQENRDHILNAFIERRDAAHFCRLVPNADIAANDYNIAVSSYVEQEDTREVVDIVELNVRIARIVAREDELRRAIDEIVNDLEGNRDE